MKQWRKDGITITEAELGDLAPSDGEVLCELDGVHFRFTAETIGQQRWRSAPSRGAAVVLTLRQIDGPPSSEPIYLVEFSDASRLDGACSHERQCGQLADAREIADRTTRRYLCAELFRRAGEMIAGDQAA